jgi:hypothetical protein
LNEKELKKEICPCNLIENVSEKGNLYFRKDDEINIWDGIDWTSIKSELSEIELAEKQKIVDELEIIDRYFKVVYQYLIIIKTNKLRQELANR